ncbi:MAG TPA: GntR family transcriptional regulator [Candidatus Omnitrophica bacterium]|nr:GntR family transcriptional regulator [Candidatus Omnitrophota bacterium]
MDYLLLFIGFLRPEAPLPHFPNAVFCGNCENLNTGQLKIEEKLPSEDKLAQVYGVSRMTTPQA